MPEQTAVVLVALNAALRQLKLYPPEHPLCVSSIDDAFRKIEVILSHERRVTIGLSGEMIICDGQPLVELVKRTETLCSALRALDTAWITFGQGLTPNEVMRWLLHLRDTSRQGDVERATTWRGVAIHMGAQETTDEAEALDRPRTMDMVDAFSDWLRIKGGARLTGLRELMNDTATEVGSDELLLSIVEGALDANRYAVRRGVLVSLISMAIARRVGIDRSILCDIGLAGLFCDIGLASVNDQLLKDKHDDRIDIDIWNAHPVEGARILLRAEAPAVVVAVTSEHHWGLRYASPERHPFSSVVGIADDIVGRILGGYGKPGHRLDTAIIGLAREGSHYPHELIWLVFQMSGLFKEGSRVRLSNNKRATIELMNVRDPLRPRVILDETEPPGRSCDLSELPGGPSIAALVND